MGNFREIFSCKKGKLRETFFVQRLAVNNMFEKLIQLEWVSQIFLYRKGEAEI